MTPEERGRARARAATVVGVADIEAELAYLRAAPGFTEDKVAAAENALDRLRDALRDASRLPPTDVTEMDTK